jgi:hypothetical protein
MEAVRVCRACGEAKPETNEFFSRHSSHAGGLNARCKACISKATRAWKDANPERAREIQRRAIERYKERHPEKFAAIKKHAMQQWVAKNRDHVNAKSRERKKVTRPQQAAILRAWRAKNIDRARETDRRWRAQNIEKARAATQRHRRKNLAADAAKAKKWRDANPDKVRAMKARHYAEVRAEAGPRVIRQRFGNLVKSVVRQRLGGGKARRSWVDLVGYDVDALIAHIERQFTGAMRWGNWGAHWHLDHIVPVTAFNISGVDCPEFRACWALTNLRPLRVKQNLSKASKRLHLL